MHKLKGGSTNVNGIHVHQQGYLTLLCLSLPTSFIHQLPLRGHLRFTDGLSFLSQVSGKHTVCF